MGYAIAAAALLGLLWIPVRLRFAGDSTKKPQLALMAYWGPLRLFVWEWTLEEDGRLKSRARWFILTWMQDYMPRAVGGKRRGFDPEFIHLRVHRLRVWLSLPWQDGWETLSYRAAAEVILSSAERLALRYGARPENTCHSVTISLPQVPLTCGADAEIRWILAHQLLHNLKKAVKKNGTPHRRINENDAG